MAHIECRAVSKQFRQHKRFSGLFGGLRTLFTSEYSEVSAVSEISFDIQAGEAVGYLGPNGAGKSTMIKMMTGILVPSSGSISVLGRTPHLRRMQNAQQIGVVFGQRSQLWWDLPVRDSFDLHAHIYGVGASRYAQNLKVLGELLELTPFFDRAVRQLSLGQRMRAEIAMALLHDPKVLFLDEPTIGLDVVAKDSVRRFLSEINRTRDVTIILTTHDLQDIEMICPRLIMVDQGKLIFDGELRKLRSTLGYSRKLTLEFVRDPGVLHLKNATLAADDGCLKHYQIENDGVSLVGLLEEIGAVAGIKDIGFEEPSIEEVIRAFYQRRTEAGLAAS